MLKKGEQTRRHILYCAEKVFSQKGYYLAQVSDISNMAQVAKGTIYQYFKNKESLFISLIEKYVNEWEKEVELNLNDFFGDGRPRDYAKAYIRHRLEKTVAFFVKNEDRTNIALRMGMGVNEVIEQVVHLFEEKVMRTIMDDIKMGQKFGHIKKDFNVELTANAILGGIMRLAYFYFVLKRESYSKYNIDSFSDQIVKLVENILIMFEDESQ